MLCAQIILGPAGEGQAGERVLTHHGRAAVMRDPGGAEFPWEGARQGMLEGCVYAPLLCWAYVPQLPLRCAGGLFCQPWCP